MNMLFRPNGFMCVCLILLGACGSPQPTDDAQADFDPLVWVDPFIGTGEHGHTFPGATTPFGMVQLSPDTHLPGWDASSGYHDSDSVIYGFSHTHLSGTGIGDMGDFLFLPYTGESGDSLIGSFDKSSEQATPGYYSVAFDNFEVTAELTATPRTGMHRYTYAEGAAQQLFFNLGHVLQPNWGHTSVAATLEFVDAHTIRGSRYSSGWAYDHRVYFYATFSQPYEVIRTQNGTNPVTGDQVEGALLKTWLRFPNNPGQEVEVQVAISPVSVEGALANWEAEAKGKTFAGIREAAAVQWRTELSRIHIQTPEETVMKNFYTACYHSMVAPMLAQDVDGKYRGIDKKIHQAAPGFTNYTVFSMWDTFRALHPYLSIVDEDRTRDFVGALIRKYEEGGILPKWPLASNYTGTMVGYPAVSVIADAIEKGIVTENLDLALEAAVYSSEYHPELLEKLVEPRATELMIKQVDYVNRMPYIPADSVTKSVSYGLECAYYDWCIAQMATRLGKTSIADRYTQRAGYYRNYFDPQTGFMRGKLANGEWKEPFSPSYSDHDKFDFVEGNAWQWSWFVPHDVEGMMELHGGKDLFSNKLDALFSASSEVEGEHASSDISGLIGQYAHGNEPSHHVAHLYNYADRPEKTQERVDEILQTLYAPTPAGISGNEDCGAMSAWYILNALGFYQVCPGKPEYSIGRPLVDHAEIQLPNGGVFTIIAHNNSLAHKYIDRMELNGEALEKPFFNHAALKSGGKLEFWMR